MIRSLRVTCFLFIAALLLACSDSDQYLFNGDNEDVSVSAAMTISFDSTEQRVKSDTIRPGDSLIFLSSVYPSKSIRNQRYLWLLDGNYFAGEYSFKKSIDQPGIHEIAFLFIDFYGDTLSDTLSVTVANPPRLDNLHYIPAANTQSIPPDEALTFTWTAVDPDSRWQLFHHFTLTEVDSIEKILVDTVLTQANFIYRGKLAPLKKYQWSVSVYNELQQTSEQPISSFFYAKGADGENAIMGTLTSSADEETLPYYIVLFDSNANLVYRNVITASNGSIFNIAPLSDGKYTMHAAISDYPDFEKLTEVFTVRGNQVLELDSLIFCDKTPPTISTLSQTDSLDIADTLRFLLHDGGGKVQLSKTSIKYDGANLSGFTLSGDTLSVPFNTNVENWSYKIISVSTTDNSGNRNGKNFILRPNTTLTEVFGD